MRDINSREQNKRGSLEMADAATHLRPRWAGRPGDLPHLPPRRRRRRVPPRGLRRRGCAPGAPAAGARRAAKERRAGLADGLGDGCAAGGPTVPRQLSCPCRCQSFHHGLLARVLCACPSSALMLSLKSPAPPSVGVPQRRRPMRRQTRSEPSAAGSWSSCCACTSPQPAHRPQRRSQAAGRRGRRGSRRRRWRRRLLPRLSTRSLRQSVRHRISSPLSIVPPPRMRKSSPSPQRTSNSPDRMAHPRSTVCRGLLRVRRRIRDGCPHPARGPDGPPRPRGRPRSAPGRPARRQAAAGAAADRAPAEGCRRSLGEVSGKVRREGCCARPCRQARAIAPCRPPPCADFRRSRPALSSRPDGSTRRIR